jgi:hypothetical protein
MVAITIVVIIVLTAPYNEFWNKFMSDINKYIAIAVERDEGDPAEKMLKNRQMKRFNFLLWPLFFILIIAEAEHYKLAHELGDDQQHLNNISELYDQAEELLTIRYASGASLLAPFEDPILNASVGVLPEGDGKVVLFYRGDHTQAPGRQLAFTQG